MVAESIAKQLEDREDVIVDHGTGTVYRITGYKNANKYPMSIRTAGWALTVGPDTYVLDRNGNKVTTKKLMSYVGPGQLSVDREVVKSVENFLRDGEESVQTQEFGVPVAGETKEVEQPTQDSLPSSSDEETEHPTGKSGLQFKSMKK